MEKRILQPAKINGTNISWVRVNGGALAIGHQPGEKIATHILKKKGVAAVVTLLQGSEGALGIGEQVKAAGMDWLWFPFSASRPHKGEDAIHVFDLFMQLDMMLASGEKIYMHCSAGIHRSGMMAYGLLRYLGMQMKESLKTLRQMSVVTAEQASVERLAWAEQFSSE